MKALLTVRRGFERVIDWSLPRGVRDAQQVRRLRIANAEIMLGFVLTVFTAIWYASVGIVWCAVAFVPLLMGLAAGPLAIRRGVPLEIVAHTLVSLSFLATGVVAYRSGGLASPALLWVLLWPLSVHLAFGGRSAFVWVLLGGIQLLFFFALDVAGADVPQDFTPSLQATQRLVGFALLLLAVVGLVAAGNSGEAHARRLEDRANRIQERERILGDMHDGLGSQLLGLLIELRKGVIVHADAANEVQRCLDDLRLIVDSLAPENVTLSASLNELCQRLAPRCEAVGVSLRSRCDPAVDAVMTPADALQLLRAAQELVANALRHAKGSVIELELAMNPGSTVTLTVRDDGCGFQVAPARSTRGRGLTSLRARAARLGGTLELDSTPERGTLARVVVPRG